MEEVKRGQEATSPSARRVGISSFTNIGLHSTQWGCTQSGLHSRVDAKLCTKVTACWSSAPVELMLAGAFVSSLPSRVKNWTRTAKRIA